MVSMGHCMVSVQFDLWSGRLESECTSWWSTEGSGVYHSAVMSWPYLRKSQNRDIEPKLLRNQSDVGRAALDSARKAQALTGQRSLQIHRTLNSANVKNYIGVGVRNGLLGFECVTSACFLYDAGSGVNHTQFLPLVSHERLTITKTDRPSRRKFYSQPSQTLLMSIGEEWKALNKTHIIHCSHNIWSCPKIVNAPNGNF